jgi:hypothetical protein
VPKAHRTFDANESSPSTVSFSYLRSLDKLELGWSQWHRMKDEDAKRRASFKLLLNLCPESYSPQRQKTTIAFNCFRNTAYLIGDMLAVAMKRRRRHGSNVPTTDDEKIACVALVLRIPECRSATKYGDDRRINEGRSFFSRRNHMDADDGCILSILRSPYYTGLT